MSKFLDFFGNIVPITGNSVADTFWFWVIGVISFAIGWFVGGLFDDPNSRKGAHWIVRIVVFFSLWAISVLVVRLVLFLISIPWWVWIIIGVVIIHIIAGIIVLVKFKKKKPKKKQINKDQD